MGQQRVAVAVLLCAVAVLVAGCGGGVAGQQREQAKDTGRASDATALAPGANDAKASTGKSEVAGVELPKVRDLGRRDSLAYALVPDLLLVISLADPAQPKAIGRQVLTRSPLRLALDGTHAYVACGKGGLQIVNLSQANAPQLVGSYAPNAGTVTAVAVRNGLAVVANGNQLAVLDVREPTRITEQKVVTADGPITDVALQGTRAYVVAKTLSIVDLAKPTEAAVAGHFEVKETLRAVTAFGEHTALLADEVLHVLNLASPERPIRTAELTTAALKTAFGEAAATKPVAAGGNGRTGATTAAATDTGANGTRLMRDSTEVPAADAQAKPDSRADGKADTPAKSDGKGKAGAKAAVPAPPPVRLVVVDDRLYLLRDGSIYVLRLDEKRQLAAVAKLTGLTAPSALAVTGQQLLVGFGNGEVQLFEPGDQGYQKTSSLTLETQETPAPKTADEKLPVPASKASQDAMKAAPEPSSRPPDNAPRP